MATKVRQVDGQALAQAAQQAGRPHAGRQAGKRELLKDAGEALLPHVRYATAAWLRQVARLGVGSGLQEEQGTYHCFLKSQCSSRHEACCC